MIVTFLSDYGYEDDFVGVCHAVIASIAPDARVIDLSHGLPRHQVRPAALALRNALPYTPPGVHLAVVDPEVGAERRAVALRTADDDRLLVGPDNGLLALAAARFGGSSRSPRRSTGATSSRPSPRTSPTGGRWARPASRSTQRSWSASSSQSPAATRTAR